MVKKEIRVIGIDDSPFKKFKKGNPGRPKGILNKDTQARNAILEKFLYREGELSKIEFKQLLQAVVTLLPKKFQGEGFSSKDLTYIYYGDRKKELENLNTGRSLSTP